MRITIVPDYYNVFECIHFDDISERTCKHTINLTWQLQLDGTFRKVGACRKCGQIITTREIRKVVE